MRSFKKRLFKHPLFIRFLSHLIVAYIRIVFHSGRKRYVIDPASASYMRGEENAVFAFWHGRILQMLPICPPRRRMHVLSSRHSDGALIALVVRRFGNATINGSSSKGGTQALRGIMQALKDGDNISITPDGPRGPVQIAGPGTPVIARLSHKPVIPVTFSAVGARQLQTWDRFLLAWPFSRLFFCVGEPIWIDRKESEEDARMRIERAMNALVEKADAMI